MEKLFIYIMFFHWVADFLCQSDWMALNKSKRPEALAIHVLVYTAVMLVAALAWLSPDGQVLTWTLGLTYFIAINGMSHFIIDALTSRANSLLWEAEKRHWFFVSIGFDQLLHTVILVLTLRLLV